MVCFIGKFSVVVNMKGSPSGNLLIFTATGPDFGNHYWLRNLINIKYKWNNKAINAIDRAFQR
jgi:hypothetical protein